jgi:dTDP-4-amino-4,6-dideoxygalactose transaminase
MIYCAYPKAQFDAHEEEIRASINKFLEKGIYILGEDVKRFEEEFGRYLGVNFGLGVADGTEAITLALKALKVGEGDEVITVSHTAVATVVGVEATNAKVVFSDIDPDFYTIDVDKLEALITPKTKAIVVVHIYGQSCDLGKLLAICKKHNLFLVEDCAQCHGALWNGKKLGSFGDVSTFSFYPTKNLGALGDGGFVATNSDKVFDQLKILRQYGWRERYISEIKGMNSRLDEIQAGILSVKLKYLDSDNSKRREIARIYNEAFVGLPIVLPKVRSESEHAFHLYAIQTEKRDELIDYLKEREIHALIHYPQPIHLQPAYISGGATIDLPVTEKLSKSVLSLPMYPELSTYQQNLVINAVNSFFSLT